MNNTVFRTIALLLLCAAYVLPGVFGRDPWRNADLVAYAQMAAIADGRAGWIAPTLGGVPGDTALLAHALGAGAIDLGSVGDTPPIFAQAGGSDLVYAAASPSAQQTPASTTSGSR